MPRVKPAAGMPPYHHRGLPGPGQGPVPTAHGMMHRELRDPYGPGMHVPPPGHGHGHGPGPFPYDMLPPPEVLEQKLAAQRGEMQKLAVENDRLAVSHASLRKELAAAQQELQRLQAQGEAARVAEEQEMRGLLDKVGKMEAELKTGESVKVELQQAHAEAQNLVAVRQNVAANVQKLSKDLQRNLGEAQQLPALVAERDAARQEYEHIRSTFEYERKLRVDHSESLQAMKRNYDSMVAELEKLRAELRNAANIDKSGIFYNTITNQKDDGTSSHLSAGQIAYDGYGRAQARATPTGLVDPLSGSPVGAGLHSGYDPSRGNAYDASRVTSFSSSKSGTHDVPRAASGFDSLKSAGYDASKAPAIGGQVAATVAHGNNAGSYGSNQATPPSYGWVQSASTYGSVQMPPPYASGSVPSSYGAGTVHPYGSAQALQSYGQTQAPGAYGHTQLPSSYGLAQAPSAFAAAQGSSPYGLATQPPAYGSGRAAANSGSTYEAPHGRK
ncbi:unnamed protein product [Urochloa humidicola]